ncbi:response regulator receiver protein [Parvibaculum lavamentivorans DS-1]|uniref:Response regulator receiver protein n=1 Tax=Parvibaculum lavamentivorans (strain DS-1 / DSM 13023 / NCIMB 13966) TaxID=402881 RepID=A7HP54_PARL1|nr:response regulator [Parvibaculum lavamentivorans]ABS61687.1 response regulator receiver protein [Parvibaculum lavamentivorans DS-1]
MRACVLVADDDPVQLQEMVEFLQSINVDVITAVDGHDAIEQITRERPRILMLDVNMPGWDGVRVAEAARNLNHKVITMLMTAESETYHYASLADCGAVAVFRKPVQLAKISDFLRSALGEATAA